LILRKIANILANRYHILRLKRTQFDFGWTLPPDSAGGSSSQCSPGPLTGFKGCYFLGKGRKWKGREGKGRGDGRGREGKRKGKEGKGGEIGLIAHTAVAAPIYDAMF